MKVLLADDNAERARALVRLLERDPSVEVFRLAPDAVMPDAVAAFAPDVIIVDMARPDRDALESMRQVAAADPRPIVLFVDRDDPTFMEEAIGAGVSSYNVLGTPPPDVKPILRAAVALFRRHQQTQQELRASEKQLRERSAIDRAKAILIRSRRISEKEAHRWLQRQAMSRGQRLAEVASQFIREHEETNRHD